MIFARVGLAHSGVTVLLLVTAPRATIEVKSWGPLGATSEYFVLTVNVGRWKHDCRIFAAIVPRSLKVPRR